MDVKHDVNQKMKKITDKFGSLYFAWKADDKKFVVPPLGGLYEFFGIKNCKPINEG